MRQELPYSALLQNFIAPFISVEETEETFFEKCKIGVMVWNFYIADKYSFSMAAELKKAIAFKNALGAERALPELELLKRKKCSYDAYDHFIVNIEMLPRPDGSISLKAYTVPHDKIEEFMTGLSDYLPDDDIDK
ncbi:hypothetical protein LPB86_11400 [Pedobacter sp. MC2016-14]|uniref:hypothetical protein n=1 Tax=Pedobacter sp. MC2016-14 TaxID=2897327 RepID=UPI001E63764B|nr:hypothetical protein [Pedobacter sp. MC2016-14]MCD0488838.1 hypothetical protein [Pedobacter sp. MC2016-14]